MKALKASFYKTGIILKTAFSLSPSLILLIPVISLINAIYPFVNYVFTLLILDELTASAVKTTVFMYAGCAVGANAILLLLINVCNRVRDARLYLLELK